MNDYSELRLFSEMFNDVQEFRKATANKITSSTVDPAFISATFDHYTSVEHQLSLAMKKCMKKTVSPGILTWQKEQKGIGEHLLARLLGATGDPRVAEPKHWEGNGKGERVLVADETRLRTVAQLWSYCGHGDPNRKLHKGMSAEEVLAVGNQKTKAIVWNLAGACLKAGIRTQEDGTKMAISDYGQVYLDRREATSERVHADNCVRCGPSGKPALAGSSWSKAHQHADAMRLVGKAVLKDLWLAADDQIAPANQWLPEISGEPEPS